MVLRNMGGQHLPRLHRSSWGLSSVLLRHHRLPSQQPIPEEALPQFRSARSTVGQGVRDQLGPSWSQYDQVGPTWPSWSSFCCVLPFWKSTFVQLGPSWSSTLSRSIPCTPDQCCVFLFFLSVATPAEPRGEKTKKNFFHANFGR